jgi:hypothetical protein
MWRRNLSVLVNFPGEVLDAFSYVAQSRQGQCIPRHVPNERSWCLDIEVARLAMERRT